MQQLSMCPLDGSIYTLTDASLQSSLVAVEASTASTGDNTCVLLRGDKDRSKDAEKRCIHQ